MEYENYLKENGFKEGHKVKVTAKGKEYTGHILPPNETMHGILNIKLTNGYNVGIKISEINKSEKIGEPIKIGKNPPEKRENNSKLPTISILHIGGTIAGRVDYRTGSLKVDFDAEDLISMYPELKTIANFKSTVIGKMWSEDIRFAHYTKMANEIAKEIQKGGIKGIILPHGTDTMTYTSACLSFMLENLPVPVILVGSQRSSDRGASDAGMNLICAAEFIAKTDYAGVGICMHESTEDKNCVILPGTKTRKMHTSMRDAFKPINSEPVARINFQTRKIEFTSNYYPRHDRAKPFIAKPNIEEKVAIMKSHTNLMPEQILFYKEHKYKGLVIEGTGLGQIAVGVPDEIAKINTKNFQAVKELIASGCILVMTTQCLYGRTQMHVYEDAVDLANAGVICGEDMLPETAFVKLAWLLGNYKPEEAKRLVRENLRGEISDFTKFL